MEIPSISTFEVFQRPIQSSLRKIIESFKALLHCETSCWRIAQCNMGYLAIFLLREALHEVELSSTFRNGLQQLTTPLHSVSPLQQLVSQFYGSFNKGACAHFLFFVPRSIARQVGVGNTTVREELMNNTTRI